MLEILDSVIPIYLLILLGVLLKIIKVANDNWIDILNTYALYIAFPSLIFSSLTNIPINSEIDYSVFVHNSIILIGIFVFIYVVTKLFIRNKEIKNAYILCVLFSNAAYLGYPYIISLYPDLGTTISLVIGSYIFVVFTFGLSVLELSKNSHFKIISIFKNIIINPLLLSVIIGIIFINFKLSLPLPIGNTIKMLSGTASPVVLVALGIFMVRKIEFNKKLFHAVIITFIKLIIIPAIFILAAFVVFKKDNFNVQILEAGMPSAITLFALSQKYPLDKTITAYVIIISTIASFISLLILSSIL
ncbi:MAG: AEC family transporter [Ignavibacteriales bacterium]|nr:AEC family transporter [Ignavibacteriales bacterium]